MDVTLLELFDLFRWSILAALVAGAVAPLVGSYLLVRRTGFHGIALPQFAAAGVAFGFAVLPWWIENVGLSGLALDEALESPHAVVNYHLAWAAVATFGGLAALALFGRRIETETGRVAAAFALASAATVLFAQASPTGKEFVEVLLRGEILAVDLHEFETIAVVYGLVLGALVLWRRDLELVSFDRAGALVLGKPVRAFEVLLALLVGLTVSVGALVVGPIVLFGLLVLPPLTAQRLARSMRSYQWLSVALGLLAVVAGLWISFRFDWPLGPSVVVAAGAELPLAALGRRRGART